MVDDVTIKWRDDSGFAPFSCAVYGFSGYSHFCNVCERSHPTVNETNVFLTFDLPTALT